MTETYPGARRHRLANRQTRRHCFNASFATPWLASARARSWSARRMPLDWSTAARSSRERAHRSRASPDRWPPSHPRMARLARLAAVPVTARSDGLAGPAGPTARDGARDAAGPAADGVAEQSRTPTRSSASGKPSDGFALPRRRRENGAVRELQ